MGRRKCPKNTFCFNDTIIYVVCAIIIVILFNIYFYKKKDQSMINAMYESNRQLLSSVQETIGNIFNFNVSISINGIKK